MNTDEQRSAGDLVRRLKRAAAFMNKRNPHRALLLEAVQCIEDVALQLHTATHAPHVTPGPILERRPRLQPLDVIGGAGAKVSLP